MTLCGVALICHAPAVRDCAPPQLRLTVASGQSRLISSAEAGNDKCGGVGPLGCKVPRIDTTAEKDGPSVLGLNHSKMITVAGTRL